MLDCSSNEYRIPVWKASPLILLSTPRTRHYVNVQGDAGREA